MPCDNSQLSTTAIFGNCQHEFQQVTEGLYSSCSRNCFSALQAEANKCQFQTYIDSMAGLHAIWDRCLSQHQTPTPTAEPTP